VGRVTYDYKTTYLFDINAGYNGSENFAPGRRYGFFPAISAGWIVTQESFLQDHPFLNYLKGRASYGIVGNDKYFADGSMVRFIYLPDSYSLTGGGYQFGTGTSWQDGAYGNGLGNPYVSWEKAYKQNYGVDFSIFKERLMTTIDVFFEQRNRILAVRQTIPSFAAMQMPPENIGKVNNKGMEIDMKWRDKIDKVTYWVNGNLSCAKNKIVYMDEVPSLYPYTLKTGHPVDQPFGYKVLGFYYEGMENDYSIADHSYKLQPGDVVYADLNNDHIINDNDKTAIGYPNYPLLNAGVTIGLEWKGFDLSLMFIGATNTSRLLQETFRTPFGDTNDRSLLKSQYDNHWTPETAASATLPRATFSGKSNNYEDSELWLVDASYLRLKNVEIGYNFSFPFMKAIGMSKWRIYANGYNLFTIDKLKIADPETKTSDRPTYPLVRVINFGINAIF
jgi:TonB-linked SusC/RagA family outer membrane protein